MTIEDGDVALQYNGISSSPDSNFDGLVMPVCICHKLQ